MPHPAFTLSIDSIPLARQVFSRANQLRGTHTLRPEDIFDDAFMEQHTKFSTFEDFVHASNLPLLCDSKGDRDYDSLRHHWQAFVQNNTDFSSLHEMTVAGAIAWLNAQFQSEYQPPTPNQSSAPTDQAITPTRATKNSSEPLLPDFDFDPNRIPEERVKKLASLGLATIKSQSTLDVPLTSRNSFVLGPTTTAAVVPTLDAHGEVINLVMVRTGSGVSGRAVKPKYFYSVVAAPRGELQAPHILLDTFVFDENRIATLEAIAWTTELALQSLPFGTLAEYAVLGEGEFVNALIATVEDTALVGGKLLRVGGKVAAAVQLEKAAKKTVDAINVAQGGFAAGQSVQLFLDGNLSEAKAKALQATFLLWGARETIVTRVRRKSNPAVSHFADDAVPDELPKNSIKSKHSPAPAGGKKANLTPAPTATPAKKSNSRNKKRKRTKRNRPPSTKKKSPKPTKATKQQRTKSKRRTKNSKSNRRHSDKNRHRKKKDATSKPSPRNKAGNRRSQGDNKGLLPTDMARNIREYATYIQKLRKY